MWRCPVQTEYPQYVYTTVRLTIRARFSRRSRAPVPSPYTHSSPLFSSAADSLELPRSVPVEHAGNTCNNETHQCCTNPFGFFGVHSRFKQEIGRRAALVVASLCNLTTVATLPLRVRAGGTTHGRGDCRSLWTGMGRHQPVRCTPKAGPSQSRGQPPAAGKWVHRHTAAPVVGISLGLPCGPCRKRALRPHSKSLCMALH